MFTREVARCIAASSTQPAAVHGVATSVFVGRDRSASLDSFTAFDIICTATL